MVSADVQPAQPTTDPCDDFLEVLKELRRETEKIWEWTESHPHQAERFLGLYVDLLSRPNKSAILRLKASGAGRYNYGDNPYDYIEISSDTVSQLGVPKRIRVRAEVSSYGTWFYPVLSISAYGTRGKKEPVTIYAGPPFAPVIQPPRPYDPVSQLNQLKTNIIPKHFKINQ